MNGENDTRVALSIPQAMVAANLGRTKLYEVINEGELPVVKIGSRTLILLDDLKAWLARHRSTAC